jgi:putative membrane protein
MKRNIIALSFSTALVLSACQKNDPGADNDIVAVNTPTVGNAETANTGQTTALDTAFVTDGIKGDTAEVSIGHLASSKGATQGVRDFANMLVTDHSAHKQKLIDLANSAGVAVPTEPAETGRAQLEKLEKLSGPEFDRALLETLIGNHEKGIAKNEAQAKSGDAQTAELAKETVPVLKKHLAAAESLAK